MRRSLAFTILLAISLLLTGCNGALETDEVVWVISYGIDKAPDGDFLLTYRIAAPPSAAGEKDTTSGEKQKPTLITIKAPSLVEGRNLLNSSVSRAVSMTHVTTIVLGEDLARSGVEEIISPLVRFREFRGTIFLFVAKGSARDVMAANNPELETLISRWAENYLRTYSETSYYLPCNLHQFYLRLKTMSGAPLATGYAINSSSNENKEESVITPGSKDKAYLPGKIPRQGGNPAEINCLAVFKGDKLAGFLNLDETRALGILLDKFPRGFLSVLDPLAPGEQIHVGIRNGRAPKINVDISGKTPVININVFLEGEIASIPSGIAYEIENQKLLEEHVSSVIKEQILAMLLHTQRWGADAVDFGYYIRPQFTTRQEMTAYDWDSHFRQAKFDVQVTTEIRRTGLMRKTYPIRRE